MKKFSIPITKFYNRTPSKLRQEISFIVDFLNREYKAHCFIVGGAVRDFILKRNISDIDVEVFNISVENFSKAMNTLGASGVGKSFFVYKFGNIDISLPRVEKKINTGHKGFKVSVTDDLRVASIRRDFTINALMLDTESWRVIDFWGGIKDLENKTLQVVNRDSFIEDSLRVLRGVQFSARFAFRFSEESCRVCKEIDLNDLSKERIFGEFKKLFKAKYLHFGLKSLISVEVDKKIFGFQISRLEFFKVAKAFLKYNNNFQPHLKEFYFLAILSRFIEFDMEELLRDIGAPKIYYKKLLEAKYPKTIQTSFIANLAKKEPVNSSILSYDDEVISIAKKIGVWDKSFDIGVTPKELLKRGFKGKALGEELERLRLEKIKELENKFSF